MLGLPGAYHHYFCHENVSMRYRHNGLGCFVKSKCPKFGVIANLEVESVVNTFAVIIHLKLSHYGNDRLRKRV